MRMFSARNMDVISTGPAVNLVLKNLARIFHELPAPTADVTVLPGVLGCSFDYAQDKLTLRRTVQVGLGSNPLRLPGGTLFSTLSRRQFVKYPG
jgi:hypothetical protein